MQHDYNDLIRIFNETFIEKLNTELKLGGDEPVYLPASDEYPIIGSSLHEAILHQQCMNWHIGVSQVLNDVCVKIMAIGTNPMVARNKCKQSLRLLK